MLHSKSDEDLGKAKDATKQVQFESSTIKNISDLKQFEAPDQDLPMHPQHHNLALVEETDWTSQNHRKQPKTTTPRKSQR